MKIVVRAVGALALVSAIACGGPPAASPNGGEGATFAQQANEGAKLYGDQCASCHGAQGEGVDAPRVVGLAQGALPLNPPAGAKARKGTFRTAADVAGFVVKAMPPDSPGSLSEAQYWAILAFDLKANGVDLGAKRLDARTAPTVVIHP